MTKPSLFLTSPRHFWFWLWLFSLPIPVMAITWTNQQAADLVLGQATFTTNSIGSANNALYSPAAVMLDPTTGKVFIVDTNHRLLRFASLNSLTNGATAEAVFGGSQGCAANQLYNPIGITMDGSGHLWVSDHNNSRILRFDNAATITTGTSATGVLGQPNFTTCSGSVTQNTINHPCSITADNGGRLWVAECNSHRVLRFDNVASKANGANADGVLG